MARISKEKRSGGDHHWKAPGQVRRRREQASKNPTLIPQDDIVVRVASFTFRFVSVEHLRDCLAYFQKKTHPSGRYPSKRLASEIGPEWRKLRGWEVERWYERLPMYLLEEPKRQKVVKALEKALKLVESEEL